MPGQRSSSPTVRVKREAGDVLVLVRFDVPAPPDPTSAAALLRAAADYLERRAIPDHRLLGVFLTGEPAAALTLFHQLGEPPGTGVRSADGAGAGVREYSRRVRE